jgi:hypothetical protein
MKIVERKFSKAVVALLLKGIHLEDSSMTILVYWIKYK